MHTQETGITQVTAMEGKYEVMFAVPDILSSKYQLLLVLIYSEVLKEEQWYYNAVKSSLCPKEKMKVNEPENQCFVFSCYPNWFHNFLYFYVIFPLGHLMQIKATQSVTVPTLERPPLRNGTLYLWLLITFLNHFLKFCDPHIHTLAEVLGQECLGENGRSRSRLTLQNYLNLTSLLTNSPILVHKAAPCEEFSELCLAP